MDDILKGKKAALIDMDGVIYDSMKYHAEAFRRLFEEEGVPGNPEDVYLYEGMRGADLVNMSVPWSCMSLKANISMRSAETSRWQGLTGCLTHSKNEICAACS